MEVCYRLIILSSSLVLSCPFKLRSDGTAHQGERTFSWNYQITNFGTALGIWSVFPGFNNSYTTAPT